MTLRDDRARAIQESIREALLREWDPIGVFDEPSAQDEYDSYVGGIYRLLAGGASAEDIAAHLAKIQTDTMGLPASGERLLGVARRLKQIDVRVTPA